MVLYYKEPIKGYGYLTVIKLGSHLWRLEGGFKTPYVTVPSGFYYGRLHTTSLIASLIGESSGLFEASVVYEYLSTHANVCSNPKDIYRRVAIDYKVPTWKAHLAYWLMIAFSSKEAV
jgi:hypothetical protein